jgi:hypothetical protein
MMTECSVTYERAKVPFCAWVGPTPATAQVRAGRPMIGLAGVNSHC